MRDDDDPAREALIARLLAGEAIASDAVPEQLRDDAIVQRLLRLSRVFEAMRASSPDSEQDFAALPPPQRFGPFRVQGSIGRGGMGEVWLGLRDDGQVEQRVAIKTVRADHAGFSRRLREERRILARLDHPNIARFVDAGLDPDGRPWLALEYVDGRTITQWAGEQRPDLGQRLRLMLKVCAAVEHAHRHLIVHRDIKPNNVLVGRDGEPKLLDFGIAKLLDAPGEEPTLGWHTPAYAAPEQLRGEAISTATDVYALGLLLFRLLAGVAPETRTHDTPLALLAALPQEESLRPSRSLAAARIDLPYAAERLRGDLDAIVARALRAAPEARYPTVRALAEDIERFLDARPVRAREPTAWYRASRFVSRHRLGTALTGLVLIALFAITAVSLQQRARAEREAASARQELARAERLGDFLASLFREQDPLSRSAARSRPPERLLAEAVTRVERELADDALSRARLLRVLGEGQLNLGQSPQAEATLARAARSLDDAGNAAALAIEIETLRGDAALRRLGHEDAERHFTQASDAATRAFGADSVERARVDARHALALVQGSNFKQARTLAENAHRRFAERLGAQDPETLDALAMLGVILEQVRDDAAARRALEQALAGIEARFGSTDARLIGVLLSLGELHRRSNAFDPGRAALQRAAALTREHYGERHAERSMALTRLAALEIVAGDSDAAIQALDAAEQAVPEGDHAARAQVLASRGRARLDRGDGVAAEPDLREALRLRRELGGERNGIAWYSQAELGMALSLQSRFDEAERLQREASDRLRALLGPDAYQNALLADRLAITYVRSRRWPDAIASLREAVRVAELTYGPDHVAVFEYRRKLVEPLSQQVPTRAEARALGDTLAATWNARADVAKSLAELAWHRAQAHAALGYAAKAAAIAREALARADWPSDAATRAGLEGLAAAR
jgi:serine/threonine protein kinase